MAYKAVLFDMDGTILDTSEDLVAAVNYAMEKCGHRHDYTKEHGCLFFGSGVHTAIQRALAVEKGMSREEVLKIGTPDHMTVNGIDEEEVEKIKAIYMPYYKEHSAEKTGPFPGILTLMKEIREAGIKTAVVSNKPHAAVVDLAEKYFPGLFDCSLGETAGIARKPAADMNEKILAELGVEKKDAVYVGDTEVDLQTAENSGLECICVNWGFRSAEELKALGAKHVVEEADAILQLVR